MANVKDSKLSKALSFFLTWKFILLLLSALLAGALVGMAVYWDDVAPAADRLLWEKKQWIYLVAHGKVRAECQAAAEDLPAWRDNLALLEAEREDEQAEVEPDDEENNDIGAEEPTSAQKVIEFSSKIAQRFKEASPELRSWLDVAAVMERPLAEIDEEVERQRARYRADPDDFDATEEEHLEMVKELMESEMAEDLVTGLEETIFPSLALCRD
jgi:hypothetical protein